MLRKRRLDIKITKEELDAFRKINVKMESAERVLRTPNSSEEFYSVAIKHREEIQFELADWWDKMIEKYNVPSGARVDLRENCLFEAVDENGKVSEEDGIDPNSLEYIN